MRRPVRIALAAVAALALLAVVAVVAGIMVLRGPWLRERVRQAIVNQVERATGGRTEVGSFSFDWRRLTAEVRGFTLHGAEPAGKPPLFQARSIQVALTIVSFFGRKARVGSVTVEQPRIYLIVYPGGGTNVPAPKVRRPGKPIMQTILDLAVGRFQLNNGLFEMEGQGTTPFQLRGQNLQVRLGYDFSGPRYAGDLSMRPLHVHWGRRNSPLPVEVNLALDIRTGRVQIASGRLVTGNTTVDFSGAVTDLAPFEGAFDYQARASLPDLERILEIRSPPSGQALVSGRMTFAGIRNYHLTGRLHASDVAWRQDPVRLAGFRTAGEVSWTPERLQAAGLRVDGTAYIGKLSGPQPVTGRIETVTLRGRDLAASGISLALMGGSFAGRAALGDWRHYRVSGEVAGFEARRLLALYSPQRIPWDGLVSGPVQAAGDLRVKSTLTAGAQAAVSPAAAGPPVRGAIQAVYNARGGTLDLGRSWIELPATRAEFSGILGRRLAARVESRNLDDVLPALNAASLPLRLENGTASFQGAVSGPLDEPRVEGRVALARFSAQGVRLDSFNAAVAVSKTHLKLEGASVTRGKLRAEFSGAADLDAWKLAGASRVQGAGTLRNAPVAELLAIAGRGEIQADGTLDVSAKLGGAYDSPELALDLTAVNGSLYGEPFDRAAARVAYAGDLAQLTGARITAGGREVRLEARYRHRPGQLDHGRLTFDIAADPMPLEQIATLHRQRPDLTGRFEFQAAGQADVAPGKGGQPAFQLAELRGRAFATGVAVNGRQLGELLVTAVTGAGVLKAVLTSDFAGSAVRGEGSWKLSGDNAGAARLSFTRLDFMRLRQLFAGPASRVPVAGSMAGEVTVDGPLLQPYRWKARLNASELQLGPSPDLNLTGGSEFALRNAGPVTAVLSEGVLRVEQARFVGRATDLTLTGTVALQQAKALDLRLSGRADLSSVQDLDPDITASGMLQTDAAIRGSLAKPQFTGRLEMRDAAFSLEGFPNGIYNANGALVFTGTRANIQNFTGESGGGKVRAFGFVGYEAERFLFRLFLRGEQVRVRYPEGVSTIANAALNWTGGTERSTLAGTITILRTGFNPHSDFSSILAKSTGPVRTVQARGGILGGLQFDVQIETSPDITFESSLAQDIEMEANLRLRGTGANPSLLGRIGITRGQIVFFGTRYTINQGAISFFNPSRIDPVLNVDLETRARGVDVTLTVAGPVNRLNLTPRSDPPLQFNEIVALLATGRSPTETMRVGQSPASQQAWQQLGASALLGQAIASPVAGRLQRFFGVTRLKIDPSLTGVESNPQARVTLEQQVTPNITFTYITNVTNTNPLVVQVEWALSRKWSVIAVRDENGMFGMDFLYKKRF